MSHLFSDVCAMTGAGLQVLALVLTYREKKEAASLALQFAILAWIVAFMVRP